MSYQENQILKQQLRKALERITYLEGTLAAKDKTIRILQDKIDYIKETYRMRQTYSMSPNHYSTKSYDSIERVEDEEDTMRDYLQVALAESGNFDNTLDENMVGEKHLLKIPELQRVPFFEQGSSLYLSSPIKSSTQISNLDILSNYESIKNQKSLFKSFIVVASDRTSPITMYRYPETIQCQQAILELIYPSVILKPLGKSKGYNDLMRTASNTIKDKFIIPLKRQESLEKKLKNSEQYQYLIGFEVQDIFFEEGIVNSHPVFYCFLSDNKCIGLFYELLNLIISTINATKNQIALTRGIGSTQSLVGNGLLKTTLQQSHLDVLLSRINRNKFQYNQHLRIKLNKDQTFIEEIPAKQNESDLIFCNPLAISISSYKTTCKFMQHNSIQCNLIPLMLVYFAAEKRIVIYSTNKQKVSMCIMLLLQLIKPLQFVNPIIQGQLKEQYLEYLEAPMAMLIGLWGQKKSSRKIDLSLRLDLSLKKNTSSRQNIFKDEFQKQKIQIKDGIIFNLDLQKSYGQSDPVLNTIVTHISKQSKKCLSASYYKRLQSLIHMVMSFQLKSDWATLFRSRIQSTQMFCYHRELKGQL